jgi:hypothetical protein
MTSQGSVIGILVKLPARDFHQFLDVSRQPGEELAILSRRATRGL